MIGLGSNRLSVCRRGGMSVTQAGRGGMEWLAGGRVPDWVTPYSAQATAALKAQFPTQWPTIRDYGVAHPWVAPYVNEDYLFVCSLGLEPSEMSIPMPVRMLIANNNAWINTGYMFAGSIVEYDLLFRLRSLKSDYRTVTGSQDSSNARVLNVHFTSSLMQVTSGDRGANAGIQISGIQTNTLYHLVASSNATTGYIYANLNGIDYTPLALGGTNNVGRNIPLFCKNHVGTIQEFFDEPVGRFVMKADGQNVREFYPFKRNGVLGMIDVLHDVLYTNAGSGQFTEEFGYMQNGSWVPWTPAS